MSYCSRWSLTQLRPLKLHNTQPSRSQTRRDLIHLCDGLVVSKSRKRLAVVFGLVVDFGVVLVRGGFFYTFEHESDFGGGQGLFVAHVAEFETGCGFFVTGWGRSATRGLLWGVRGAVGRSGHGRWLAAAVMLVEDALR